MKTATEKVKIALAHKGWNLTQLAEAAGMSKQNLHSKLSKDNLNETDLTKLTEAMGIQYEITLTLEDGTKI